MREQGTSDESAVCVTFETASRVINASALLRIAAASTPHDRTSARERHLAATGLQRRHTQEAARNSALLRRPNADHPAIRATPGPAAFHRADVALSRTTKH